MGTPDAFIAEDFRCPQCGRVSVCALQTKALPYPYMDEIRLGDELPNRMRSGEAMLDIREGRVLCWGGCPCGCSFQYYARIANNRWVGLELASIVEPARAGG